MEILQRPGETVYVPAGWWHVVVNLDTTVAVTQNSGEPANWEAIRKEVRVKRPDIAEEWEARAHARWPTLPCEA